MTMPRATSIKQVIDLTTTPDSAPDRLSTLPPELLHLILDTLFPTHQPNVAFEDGAHRAKLTHPLEHLSLTSRYLHEQVHGWAKSWLVVNRQITKYKDLKTAKLQRYRDHLRGKGGLLTWSERHCVFCGKGSARSAILANGLKCCAKCDKEQWPDKITKTAAKAEYDLKDQQLLHGKNFLHPQIGGLPRLHYGTYFSANVPTTMFLRADVERLAKALHGDLEEHMSAKRAASGVRKQKKIEKEEKEKQRRRVSLEKIKESSPFKYARESGGSNVEAGRQLQALLEQNGLTVNDLTEGNAVLRMHLGLQ